MDCVVSVTSEPTPNVDEFVNLDQVSEESIKPVVQPNVTQPAVSAIDTSAMTRAVALAVTQAVTEAMAQAMSKPLVRPVVPPTATPAVTPNVVQPVVKPVSKHVVQPVVQPVVPPAAPPMTQAVVQPGSPNITNYVIRPVTHGENQKMFELVIDPVAPNVVQVQPTLPKKDDEMKLEIKMLSLRIAELTTTVDRQKLQFARNQEAIFRLAEELEDLNDVINKNMEELRKTSLDLETAQENQEKARNNRAQGLAILLTKKN